MRASWLLALVALQPSASKVSVRFHEPVVLSGRFANPEHAAVSLPTPPHRRPAASLADRYAYRQSPWEPATIDGNESIGCDSYHALSPRHLFGQVRPAPSPHRQRPDRDAGCAGAATV